MDVLSFGLIALASLLALVPFLDFLATRTSVALPVLAAAVGLITGLLAYLLDWSPLGAALDTYDAWFFDSLALTPESVIYIFLPPLLFEMTLGVDIRKLRQDLVIVATMAVFAVVVSTAAVGGLLAALSGFPLVACLLLGATVSTTDPAAVVTIFRRIGAPRRLLVVLEGESLLNDAAAIALFALLVDLATHGGAIDIGAAAKSFLYLFSAGALCGFALGYLGARLMPLLRNNPLAQTSLTVSVAYGSFLIAEMLLAASGVVAVVGAGLTMAVAGTSRVSNEEWGEVTIVWSQLGYWSNGLIVLISAWLVPGLVAELDITNAPLVLAVIVAAFAARWLILFVVLPALDHLGIAAPIVGKQKLLIWWGGIRGAVTLLLALSLTAGGLPENLGRELGAIGCGFVFFTLLVNAGSLAYVTRLLGLDRLSSADEVLRGEIIAGTMRAASEQVQRIADVHQLPPEDVEPIRAHYQERLTELLGALPDAESSLIDRQRTGLIILANQERRLIRRHYDGALIGRSTMRAMQRHAEELLDTSIVNGREGYQRTAESAIGFSRGFRFAVALHRYFRINALLARMLGHRFHLLFEGEIVLRDLVDFAEQDLEGLIQNDAAMELASLLRERISRVEQAHRALKVQYPSYAQLMRQMFVERAALRWELQRYDRLFRDSIISPQLHRSLITVVSRRINATFRPPRLDPGLNRKALVDSIPLFEQLSRRERRRIARLVRTRVVTPGEVVASRGERSHAVCFIATGALEQRSDDGTRILGTGDFFGELALRETAERRKSDVVALGFCKLLELHRIDLQKLVKRHPTIEAALQAPPDSSTGVHSPDPPERREVVDTPSPPAIRPAQDS